MNRLVCAAGLAVVLAAGAVAASADEADDAFNQLYGADYRRAVASRDPAGAVALAGQLLAAARTKGTHPALLALLCDKACELGSKHAGGYATAVEAMNLLAEAAPDKKAACLQRIVTIRQRQFDAAKGAARVLEADALIDAIIPAAEARSDAGGTADAIILCRQALTVAAAAGSDRKPEVQAWLERFAAVLRLRRLAGDLKARVEANPADAASRKELVRLLAVELDDFAQAAPLVDESCDAEMRKYVPAAAKAVEAAPEAACLELGNWCLGLSEKAGPAGKTGLLVRAQAYFERYLALHKQEDVSRSQAALAVKKTQDALAGLGQAGSAFKADGTAKEGRWADLLGLINPAQHARGKWERRGGMLVPEDPSMFNTLDVPCDIDGSYQVTVVFAAPAKAEKLKVGVVLPVKNRSVALFVDPEKGLPELMTIHTGVAATAAGPLAKGREYTLAAKVTLSGDLVEIIGSLDDKPCLRWQGPQSAVATERAVLDSPRRLKLVGYPPAAFRSVKLRMLSGTAKVAR